MDVQQVESLLAVAECGSFAEAGRRLGVARSSLRAHVDALERDLGRALIERSARGVSLTPEGVRLLPRAREFVALARAMVDVEEPEGLLKVQMPAGVPAAMHMAVRQQFVRRLPGVRLRILIAPGRVLPEADLVFQIGCLTTAPEEYRTFVINRQRERVLGHPDYLARHGRPTTIAELQRHPLMTWCPPGEDPEMWPGQAGPHRIRVEAPSEDLAIAREFIHQGLGLARLPELPFFPFEGVLPDVFDREVVLRVLIPERSANDPAVRQATAVMEEVRDSLFPG